MDTRNSLFAAWSFGLVGGAHLVFALNLVRVGYGRSLRTSAAVALLGAVTSTSLWGWLAMAGALVDGPVLSRCAGLVDLLRYGFWFQFLLLIRPRQSTDKRLGVTGTALISVVLVVFSLCAQGIEFIGLSRSLNMARLTPMSSMALAIFGMVLLEQVFRNVAQDLRWSVKPISAGLAGIFAFDIYMYSNAVIFGQIDVDAFNTRGVIHALMAPLLFLSTIRLGDWRLKFRISRSAAFHSAALIICGIYLLLISGIGYYIKFFGGEWGRALQLCVVFLSLVLFILLSISGSMRAKLRIVLSRNFFRYRYDYREEWLKFTHALCLQGTPQEMGRQVISGLADLVESPGGGLWMKDPAGVGFQQSARLNFELKEEVESVFSDFSEALKIQNKVINMEEFRLFPRRYEDMSLPSWLKSLSEAWLIVPLVVSDDLIGFVVLLRSRITFDANWEVYDLLNTAGRQAASFLAQMVATEALLEVRKFDAFNRMSAFVVHDLKNIVTQLSLMMKNAKRLHSNPEFQQDMLDTVDNSLEKMRQLMTQLREGTTPAGTTFGVDLEHVVRQIESVASGRGRYLDVQRAEPVVVRGHEERIERVLGHLVHNALDATDSVDGAVWLRLDKIGDSARVVVGDNGHGMSAEFIRDRLFKPFQSTKSTGMGIGAYESSQYIHELGGKISVKSQPEHGTEVTVLIPLFTGRTQPDLDLMTSD